MDRMPLPPETFFAGNAIKRFASRRKIIGASFTETEIQDYLLFLSIYQTCRHKNVSFLQFLRSAQADVNEFANRRTR